MVQWAARGFDPLYDLDRNLELDEIITLRIPKDDDNIYSFNAWADEEKAGSLICLIGFNKQE